MVGSQKGRNSFTRLYGCLYTKLHGEYFLSYALTIMILRKGKTGRVYASFAQCDVLYQPIMAIVCCSCSFKMAVPWEANHAILHQFARGKS